MGFSGDSVYTASKSYYHVPEFPVVEVHAAFPCDCAGINTKLVSLLQVLADNEPNHSKERSILGVFTDEPVKSRAYQKIDKLLLSFLPNGKPYPYDRLQFSAFQSALGHPERYAAYLKNMDECCRMLLDPQREEALAYTLLELLRNDPSVTQVSYGTGMIPKERLLANPGHPKKISLPALILGLMFQTHLLRFPCSAAGIRLMAPPQDILYDLIPDTGKQCAFPETLPDILNPELQISAGEMICRFAQRQNRFSLPEQLFSLEIRTPDGIRTELPKQDRLILTGDGGSGKTTLLQSLANAQNNVVFLPLFDYQKTVLPAFAPAKSNWILLQILLRYVFQNAYRTYESCSAAEGGETVLRQLHALHEFLSRQPVSNTGKFTIILDGMNEISGGQADDLYSEIAQICENWHSCKLIVSGRNVPVHPVFRQFYHAEICGISQETLSQIQPIPDEILPLVKTPLFLQIYLQYQETDSAEAPANRAKLIEAYIKSLCAKIHDHLPLIRFLLFYAMPAAAYQAVQRHEMTVLRADFSDAIGSALDIFIRDERVYQNYIFPKNITKKALPEGSGTDDWIQLLTEHICVISEDQNDNSRLIFAHQYYRDYFAARHIFNLLEAVEAAFPYRLSQEKADLFDRLSLGELWFQPEDTELFRLLGELCGDDENKPDDDFFYRKTLLDSVLDLSRAYDTFRATENVMRTMAAVRGNVICGADFSETTLPLWIPAQYQFSNHGTDPCRFRDCRVGMIGLIDGECYLIQTDHDANVTLIWQDGYAIDFDLQHDALIAEYAVDFYEIERPSVRPDAELLRRVFAIMPHFRGCDFSGAKFLTEEAEKWMPVLSEYI